MPVHRTSTLAHFSPPKTTRTTAVRRRDSAEGQDSHVFWDPVKMGRLNASLARQRHSLDQADSERDAATRATSCEGELGSPLSVPPQLPRFDAPLDGTRETRSPSISLATTTMHGPRGPRALSSVCAHEGGVERPLSKETRDRWSLAGSGSGAGGGGGRDSLGLSTSARRSASFFSTPSPSPAMTSLWLHQQQQQSQSESREQVTTPTAGKRANTARASESSTSAVARALQRMKDTGRRGSHASVGAPRTTRAFERTEPLRRSYSPWAGWAQQPPTARNRLRVGMTATTSSPRTGTVPVVSVRPLRTSLPVSSLASEKVEERREEAEEAAVEMMLADVLVHTPRVRTSMPPAKAKTRKLKPKNARHTARVREEVPSVEGDTSQAVAVPVRMVPRSDGVSRLSNVQPNTGRRGSLASPVPFRPFTVPNEETTEKAAPSSPASSSSLPSSHLADDKEEGEALSALARQARALQQEVHHLEAIKAELQATVTQLVGQLDGAAHEVEAADRAQQGQALVSERLIRSVAADWALQQNAMVERIAMLEEERLGL